MQGFKSLRTPQQDIQIFSGDPLEYCSFISSFEDVVEDAEWNPKRRLNLLIQYTNGFPRQLVKSCQRMSPSTCYKTAKELLANRYGQSHLIAIAHIEKLTTGRNLKETDVEELEGLAVDLMVCLNEFKSLNITERINNPDSLSKIIFRLPIHWQYQWRSKSDHIMCIDCRDVNIQDIVQFVKVKVREITNPVFGAVGKPINLKQKTFQSEQPQIHTFTDCHMCSSNHYLNQCKQFRDLSVKNRIEFVNKNKLLCHACLTQGHDASKCTRVKPCMRNNCKEMHTTLLHSSNEISNSRAQITSVQTGFINNRNQTKTYLPILPVKIKSKTSNKSILTHAFLDPGSTTTFITDKLCQNLGISGPKTTIYTTTICNRNFPQDVKLIKLGNI